VLDLMAALQESVSKVKASRGEEAGPAEVHELPKSKRKPAAKKATAKKTAAKKTAAASHAPHRGSRSSGSCRLADRSGHRCITEG
jgi:DNA end-binding protein Ku